LLRPLRYSGRSKQRTLRLFTEQHNMGEIKRYAAAGGVVIHDGQLLVLERPGRKEVRLPKGHIDPGETAVVAALRETTEESGYADLTVVADLGSQLTEFDHNGQHIIRSEAYFLMHLQSRRTLPRTAEDEAQFRTLWLPPEQAVELLTFASEKLMAQRGIDAEQNGEW
jgi:8-oxo-dGTP pyrophosphatase MutT (NUDIX family)